MAARQNRAIVAAVVVSLVAFSVGVAVGMIRDDEAIGSVDQSTADGSAGQLGSCSQSIPDGESVARAWNEALLAAIRLDVPSPTVHARNLYHTSAAMWDAWAAFDETARGVFVDAEISGGDTAREAAISFAAYRVLVERYLRSPGAEESITGFNELMADLCYDIDFTDVTGPSGAALGNSIAAEILESSLSDGSNEANGYVSPGYEPVNVPLVVAEPGTEMADANRWQPLELEVMESQTGQPLDETVQTFVGQHWGQVTPFALEAPTGGRPPLDPGPPPMLGDAETDQVFKDAAVDVIAHSALLDPRLPQTVDISPISRGNAPLGTYDEQGYDVNPVTGEPYVPNMVALGDYGRAVAEFWADGPSSETPPGHWNTIANSVTDSLDGQFRIAGEGPVVDPLEWDVKLYLALNGAVHDAAVAAWGAKGYYDSARPISMIRYMGALGQSSDPASDSYHPDGLPLEAGLVEVITQESTAPGEHHDHLREHIGEVAILAWQGTPSDRENELGGVDWIRAVEWVPYQLPTFVTPAFAGYVSGHSTFSRAGAEVLAAMTGDEFFPGGLGEYTVKADSLEFEAGPDEPVTLQWATYADASDEAGRSRLFGGIHIWFDDLPGREMGFEVGRGAWAHAQEFFEGRSE